MYILFITTGLIVLIVVGSIGLFNKKNAKFKNIQNTVTTNNIPTQNVQIKETPYPYYRRWLLTNHEVQFYNILKEIAEENNLTILSKVRLADLIGVKNGLPSRRWGMYFGKIKAKHIDFIIADKVRLNPLLLIEVDDNSHNKPDRQERDYFVDKACTDAGYNIMHTRSIYNFKESVCKELKIKEENKMIVLNTPIIKNHKYEEISLIYSENTEILNNTIEANTQIRNSKKTAIDKLIYEAEKRNANAIINVQINFNLSNQLLIIMATGTAVKVFD